MFVDLCLVVFGADSVRFREYLVEPWDSVDGEKLSAEALVLAEKTRLEDL